MKIVDEKSVLDALRLKEEARKEEERKTHDYNLRVKEQKAREERQAKLHAKAQFAKLSLEEKLEQSSRKLIIETDLKLARHPEKPKMEYFWTILGAILGFVFVAPFVMQNSVNPGEDRIFVTVVACGIGFWRDRYIYNNDVLTKWKKERKAITEHHNNELKKIAKSLEEPINIAFSNVSANLNFNRFPSEILNKFMR